MPENGFAKDNESPSSKPKRGRPKGSKNKPKDHVFAWPPVCQRCGGIKFRRRGKNPARRDLLNVKVDGRECVRVRFFRTECVGCGQLQMQRECYRKI